MTSNVLRRLLHAAAVVGIVAAATVATGATPAFATNGLAIMEIFAYPHQAAQAVYGGGVDVEIEATDRSGSCRVFHDCDSVTGTSYFIMTDIATNAQYLVGTAGWQPGLLHGTSYSTLPTLYLPAGDYAFDFAYEGNFDTWDSRNDIPFKYYQLHNVITVYKRPCTPTLTVSPAVEPLNTTPVVLTLDLGAPGNTGYVDINGPTGGRLGRVGINPDGRTATFTLPFEPPSTMSFQATYSGDANNYGCTSSPATYTVPETHTGGGTVYVPAPNSDAFTTDLGTTLVGDVLSNDTPMPIVQSIRFPTQAEYDSNPGLPDDVTYLPPPPSTVGTVTMQADAGTITFVPAPTWDGTPFAFTYVAYETDDPTTSGRARVYITGRCAVGVSDSYSVQPDTTRSVPGPGVFANDTGKCGGDAQLVDAPGHGQVDLHADGSFAYTPAAGFLGVDHFSYRAADDPAKRPVDVLLSVLGGVCLPQLGADSFQVGDHALSVADPGVTANDTLCREVVDLATPPQHGTVTLSPNGAFQYTADAGYVGPDSFSYGIVQQSHESPTPPPAQQGAATVIDPNIPTAVVSLDVLPDPTTTSASTTSSTTPGTSTPTTSSAPTSSPTSSASSVAPVTTTSVEAAGPLPSTPTPVTPPLPVELPATGTDSMPTALMASLLSAIGVALLVVARRRARAGAPSRP